MAAEREAETILRDLAESDPTVHSPDIPHGHNFCTLCRVWLPTLPAPADRHTESCPWRRAAEWVRDSANQETEG